MKNDKILFVTGIILILIGAWMSFKMTAVVHIRPQENISLDGFGFELNKHGKHVFTNKYILFMVIEYSLFIGGVYLLYLMKKINKSIKNHQ